MITAALNAETLQTAAEAWRRHPPQWICPLPHSWPGPVGWSYHVALRGAGPGAGEPILGRGLGLLLGELDLLEVQAVVGHPFVQTLVDWRGLGGGRKLGLGVACDGKGVPLVAANTPRISPGLNPHHLISAPAHQCFQIRAPALPQLVPVPPRDKPCPSPPCSPQPWLLLPQSPSLPPPLDSQSM